MNKRTSHGMIFVPILCLLLALLAFAPAWNGNDDAQPPMEEAASEPAVTSYHVEWDDMIPLIGSQLLYAPPPSATVETTPPRWKSGFVLLRTKRWSLLLC